MNNEIFKKAFENVKPPEELVNRVLDVRNAPAETKKARRRGFFGAYRRAAVLAVCGIMLCGCTAAATNYIKFGSVFGDIFSAADSEFADTLVGTAKDFSYKVSDDSYQISIKGITGTKENFSVVAEISRKDGTPVDEHFINPAERNCYLSELWTESTDGFSGGWTITLNNEGNIEIYQEFRTTFEEPVDTITVKGENFYPPKLYKEFCKKNNVAYIKWDDFNFSGYAEYDENNGITSDTLTPADIDDSSVIALDLEWEFSFKPIASKNAEKGKKAKKFDENFVYLLDVHKKEDFVNVFAEYERVLTPVSIDVKPLGADIEYTFAPTDSEYENIDKYIISETNINNDIFLIMKDGSKIQSWAGSNSYSGNEDGTLYTGTMHIVYQDFSVENTKQTVVNVKDVKAISINGTVYNLK